MYVHVHVCIDMCKCAHTRAHTTHTHPPEETTPTLACIYNICIYTYVHKYLHTYKHTYIYTYMCKYMFIYMCVYIYTHTPTPPTHTRGNYTNTRPLLLIAIHAHIHTSVQQRLNRRDSRRVITLHCDTQPKTKQSKSRGKVKS